MILKIDFIHEDTFVALYTSTISVDPFYIVKMIKKEILQENQIDENGHISCLQMSSV